MLHNSRQVLYLNITPDGFLCTRYTKEVFMKIEDLTNEKIGMLREIFQRPVAYHKVFAKTVGVTGAVMLSQAIYWDSNKVTEKRDGWFYKTQEEWTEETGLTRYEQEGARKKFKDCGYLEEKLIGIPAQLWYRVNWDKIVETLEVNRQVCGISPNKYAENPQTSMGKSNIHTIHRVPIDYLHNEEENLKKQEEIPTYEETTSLDKFKNYLSTKERAKSKKEFRKLNPYKKLPKELEEPLHSPVYQSISPEFSSFMDWWIGEVKTPFAKDASLMTDWNRLRESYKVAHIRCAVKTAKFHPYWKARNTPHNLFRATNAKGQPMDVINVLLRYMGEGMNEELKPTFFERKKQFHEEMDKELEGI
jgi:hypothetical protein